MLKKRHFFAVCLLIALGCGQETGPKDGDLVTTMDGLDDVSLYLNLGDSVAAGMAAGAGYGYSNLLYENHADYGAWGDHHISQRFAGAAYGQDAQSGADSYDMLNQVNKAPDHGGGDVVVTIYVGGNDITSNPYNLFSTSGITKVIDGWTANMTEVMLALREKYQHVGEGRDLVVAIATVHDPTDGMGGIPPQFNAGFCSLLQQIPVNMRPEALANFNKVNDAIREFAAEQGAILMDSHELFLGHAMNATGSDRWLVNDCIHMTNEGHHQLRAEYWRVLTDEIVD